MAPALLAAFGAGSVGLAVVIAKLRWLFIGLALAGLATSFYFTWWKRPSQRNRIVFALTAMLVAAAISFHFYRLWSYEPAPVARRDAGLAVVRYRVEGMTCPSCAGRIRSALEALPGVEGVGLDFSKAEATLWQRSPGQVKDEAVRHAFEQQGFTARRSSVKQ